MREVQSVSNLSIKHILNYFVILILSLGLHYKTSLITQNKISQNFDNVYEDKLQH